MCQIKHVQNQRHIFNFHLLSLLPLFASLFSNCTGKKTPTYALPFRCMWSFFRSIWYSFTQIKLRSVNRQSRLTEAREHSGCVCSQLLPSNTPRKQHPAGCASCSLPGGENHSDPLWRQRQRYHSASIRYVSLVLVESSQLFMPECTEKGVISHTSVYQHVTLCFLTTCQLTCHLFLWQTQTFCQVCDALVW